MSAAVDGSHQELVMSSKCSKPREVGVNGHTANGHAANGHAANGHAGSGHAANGLAVNGHEINAHAINGDVAENGDFRSWEEQFLPSPLWLDDMERAQKIEARLAPLVLGGATLRRVTAVFEDELERGLRQLPSSLQMENTYVPELPDGTEEGVFLALDLGGTNFRVLLLELREGQLVREDVKQYHISDELRLGPGEDLFGFLADCVQDFLRSEGMEKDSFSLGFTFSFPMKQHSISSGELITWTKSFKCPGMEGVDVAALLQRCLLRRGLDVTVRVLLNDTTGTLMAGAHADPSVGVGVILGTGSNGCYMERAARVTHWEAAHERVRDVCVDVEWGAFGDNGCLDFVRTRFDREVDQRSLLVASFTFEKYIGGKYMGDILVAVLAALARDRLFPFAPAFGTLATADVSLFEEENCAGETARTLDALRRAEGASPGAGGASPGAGGASPGAGGASPGAGGAALTEEDARVVQHVAHVVSNRAAQLVSVCIASLLRRMDRPQVSVAVDGSVYKRHPRIEHLMRRYIRLLAPDHEFSLRGAEDGSGKGSALTAAIAARIALRGLP